MLLFCTVNIFFLSFLAPDCKSGGSAERDRWDHARQAAANGEFDEIPADIFIRYQRSLLQIHSSSCWTGYSPPCPDIELRPWQSDLVERIKLPPHDRQIYCVVDVVGGKGKSTFGRYLRYLFKDGVQILHPGKHLDLAYLLQRSRCYIMDCPRGSSDYIPWTFIESLKDGMVQSTKYEPILKEFPIPHVIVFMNIPVPENVLSADRVKTILL